MSRYLPFCLLLAFAGGLSAEENAAGGEAPEPAVAEEAVAEEAVAQEADAADEAVAITAQDSAEWDVRQKASYLFGMVQLGPAIQKGKLIPRVVIAGIEDSVAGVDARVPLEGAQALYEDWETKSAAVEGAGSEDLSAPPASWTDRQKISYLFGYIPLSQTVKEGKLDVPSLAQGLQDGVAGTESKVPKDQMQEIFQAYDQSLQDQAAEAAVANAAKGLAYLSAKASEEGVTATPSGLLYEVLKPGDGPQPGPNATVRVHYTGSLLDGTVFDSSEARGEPATFPVGGVIGGWTEALQLMKVGARYRLHIPPDLGYGDRGAGGDIPPGAVLIFEVELLGIE